MEKMLHRSLGMKQILHRIKSLNEIFTGNCSRLKILNFLMILTFEILLGIYLSSYLKTFPNLYITMEENFNRFLTFSMEILQWLRGAPAGFKLNAALNSLLARFFSYHLHLWRNYIGFLSPFLSIILTALVHAGYLGLSIQIALARDLLSLATFHVYCLYIYAARLFNIHTRGLISLCRLCLGRKWNPLRKRVDSIQLNNSEMFLSSLMFTIGLLLSPTIIIYYIVFLLLHVPVMLLESFISELVDLFNSIELVTALLIILNSPLIGDELYYVPHRDDTKNILYLEAKLQTRRSPITLPEKGKNVKEALKNIFQGNIL